MKFKPGDMVFLLVPGEFADIGRVLEATKDTYIIHCFFQEQNTPGKYIPGSFNKQDWENNLYKPIDKTREIITFLFDYSEFDKRYL